MTFRSPKYSGRFEHDLIKLDTTLGSQEDAARQQKAIN